MTRSVTASQVFVSRDDLRLVLHWAGHNCGTAPSNVVGAIDRLGDRELATRGQTRIEGSFGYWQEQSRKLNEGEGE